LIDTSLRDLRVEIVLAKLVCKIFLWFFEFVKSKFLFEVEVDLIGEGFSMSDKINHLLGKIVNTVKQGYFMIWNILIKWKSAMLNNQY